MQRGQRSLRIDVDGQNPMTTQAEPLRKDHRACGLGDPAFKVGDRDADCSLPSWPHLLGPIGSGPLARFSERELALAPGRGQLARRQVALRNAIVDMRLVDATQGRNLRSRVERRYLSGFRRQQPGAYLLHHAPSARRKGLDPGHIDHRPWRSCRRSAGSGNQVASALER